MTGRRTCANGLGEILALDRPNVFRVLHPQKDVFHDLPLWLGKLGGQNVQVRPSAFGADELRVQRRSRRMWADLNSE